jgi:acylphosphatase
MKRLNAVVTGIVQGVSFRHYTKMKARELGLVGWVGNRLDGSVEVMAEGQESSLEAFVEWLHEGSPDAEVDAVEVSWGEPSGEYSSFTISYGLN